MKKNNKGFSLVELIIVIAIMAVLIGLLAPQYLRFVQKSKVSADLSNAQSIATAFNVIFAEGSIKNGDTITNTHWSQAGITSQPEIKCGTGSWSVGIGSDGVSSVTIGGAQVWPTVQSGSSWDN